MNLSKSPENITISTSAKLASVMIATALTDLDNATPEHRQTAQEWLDESRDSALSLSSCATMLANLQRYLYNNGMIANDEPVLSEPAEWVEMVKVWSDQSLADRDSAGSSLINYVDRHAALSSGIMTEQYSSSPSLSATSLDNASSEPYVTSAAFSP